MGRSLLFLVSGLTIITGLIQVNNFKRISEISNYSTKQYNEEQARNISKSLIDNAIETIKNGEELVEHLTIENVIDTLALRTRSYEARKNYMFGDVSLNYLENTERKLQEDEYITNNVVISGTLDSYDSTKVNIPDNSVEYWDEYKLLLISTATYDDTKVRTEVLMQRDSYSKYSYMTESELSPKGSPFLFSDQDVIHGPIHTNGTFTMSGNPSFYGLITSPNRWVADASTSTTQPNFFGGENFNAPRKTPPTTENLINEDGYVGFRFENEIQVEFFVSSDKFGYVTITEKIEEEWGNPEDYLLTLTNGVISSSKDISVKGKVLGQVTVHSENDIIIDGDITYSNNPLLDPSSEDILGLISEKNVRIDKEAHLFEGSENLTIHASIIALKNSFIVEDYNYTPRGTLNILGGIIQNYRGPVGTFNSEGVLKSGYSKNYQYDDRLKSIIPPYFPRENVFSIVYWIDEVTHLPN